MKRIPVTKIQAKVWAVRSQKEYQAFRGLFTKKFYVDISTRIQVISVMPVFCCLFIAATCEFWFLTLQTQTYANANNDFYRYWVWGSLFLLLLNFYFSFHVWWIVLPSEKYYKDLRYQSMIIWHIYQIGLMRYSKISRICYRTYHLLWLLAAINGTACFDMQHNLKLRCEGGIFCTAVLVLYFTMESRFSENESELAQNLDYQQMLQALNLAESPLSQISINVQSPELPILKTLIPTDDDCCSICYESFLGTDFVTDLCPYNHTFHETCIDLWIESHDTCPLCRALLLT